MSEQLNEMPILKVNQDYIERLDKRAKKLRDRLYSYRWDWNDKVYRHTTTNRRMSKEKYEELQKKYFEANQKTYDIANRERTKIANKVMDYVSAILVMDKRQNPSLYPDWLSFSLPDTENANPRHYHYITPVIDLEKGLKTEDNWNRMTDRAVHRLTDFIKRYFPDDAQIQFNKPVINGIDDYIKNVFRKEIRNKIKDIDPNNCIHSIVFRVRDSYSKEVQIHPRWRDKYPCYSWNKQREIENEMRKILREYGWKLNKNYTDSTRRD